MTNMQSFTFCSGFGQFHSNESGAKNPKPYSEITLEEIKNLVDNPPAQPKTINQWLIPSNLKSRTFKEQEENGQYGLLWLDFDDNPPPLNEIKEHLTDIIGNVDFEMYNSRSATVDNQKCRVIIPLTQWLKYDVWTTCQEILNNKFEALDITPDRANQRAAQLCYLPNRGEFYHSMYRRTGAFLNAAEHFKDELLAIERRIAKEKEQLAVKQQAADKKRVSLEYSGSDKGLIQAFNEAYTVEEILLRNGYKQRGLKFCHPDSTTGNYAAAINPETGCVHTLSTKDRLYVEGSQSGHDAFSCFVTLEHDSNINAALIDAGDNHLTIDGEAWNKVKQREYMQAHENQQQPNSSDFDFSKFSLRGQSVNLEKKLLDEVYILERLALLGEITVFFAPPNSGKTLITLKLLFDAVSNSKLKGDDVFYINADDSLAGLTTKLKLCERYEIHMLAPEHNGFKTKDFTVYLDQMVSNQSAHGKVIILDTAKKFTSVMDKDASSKFNTKLREFSQSGGSVILLAHTNKNRNGDGKLVAGGTSDLIDDADCAYVIDVLNDDGHTKTVIFENQKRRGNCAGEVIFEYTSKADNYQQLVDSVTMTEDPDAVKDEMKATEQFNKDASVVGAIKEILMDGKILKTDLQCRVTDETGIPKRKVVDVIDRYAGESFFEQRTIWRIVKGQRNEKRVELLTI